MAKGGYQIIDFENRNVGSGSTQIYKGIYEILEATRSPVLITNLTLEGIELKDRFVNFFSDSGEFKAMYNVDFGPVSDPYIITVGHDTNGDSVITIET